MEHSLLLQLPHELLCCVLQYLSAAEVSSARSTCREVNAAASSPTVWAHLLARDFDVVEAGTGPVWLAMKFARFDPRMAYSRRQQQRRKADRDIAALARVASARAAATRSQLLCSSLLAVPPILAWVIAPALCAFVLVLLVALRADGRLSSTWGAALSPAFLLGALLVMDAGLAGASLLRTRRAWWSPCRKDGPPQEAPPTDFRTQPLAPQEAPPSPTRIIVVQPPRRGGREELHGPGAQSGHAYSVSLSPWHGMWAQLGWTPAACCVRQCTGEGAPGLGLAVYLLLLAAVGTPTAIAVQADTGAPLSWAIAFLPLWLILFALPMACCLWTGLKRSVDGMYAYTCGVCLVAVPLLCALVPLAMAFDALRSQELSPSPAGADVSNNGLTNSSISPPDALANISASNLIASNSSSAAMVGRAAVITLRVALVPVWALVFALAALLCTASVVSYVRYARARLADLSDELAAVQCCTGMSAVLLLLPASSLAMVVAKGEGSLVALPWTTCLAPLMFVLAALAVVGLVAGVSLCGPAVMRPCTLASRDPEEGSNNGGWK
jgi:hypothetical protein